MKNEHDSDMPLDPDMPDHVDLPDNLESTSRKKLADREMLIAIGLTLAGKRDEAVSARRESGIEETWTKCEDAYLGIDDTNRNEFQGAKWAKPTSMEGPVTTNSATPRQDVRSTVFVRLTSRYVDSGSAKLAEILLPMDDKNFKISPMPNPELTLQQDDHRPVIDNATGQLAMRPLAEGETAPQPLAAPPGTPGAVVGPPTNAQPPASRPGSAPQPPAPPQAVPLTMADLADKALNDAADSAERAESRIHGWLIDCQYPAEVRKVLFDSARIGVGVIKGPTPRMSESFALMTGGSKARAALEIKRSIVPDATWVDPWNIFPDPACGEDIKSGDYILERDFLSPKKLRELKDLPGYLPDMIDKVLTEGPNKSREEGRNPNEPENKHRYEVWYYYGSLTKEELKAARAVGSNDVEDGKTEVYAIVTIVNDTVIKADLNPLETGAFPYHAMAWSRRAGHWAGVGISEQIDSPQRIVNAGTRALLNNAGKTAGAQIVIDKMSIIPSDGSWTITPDKVWFLADGAQIDDVRKAFMSVVFPNMTAELMRIIEFGMKLAEESSNIPLVTQGINDQNTPDTYGATQIQETNAHTLLRSIGNAFDDSVTDPIVRGMYEWLLLDPDVPDDEKKEFKIDAHGSAALVERAIQVQSLQKLGNLALNPAYGVDPRKWFAEMLRSLRLDPRKIQYTEDEQEQIAKNQAPPLPIAVAQLKAQSDAQIAQAKIQGQLQLDQAQMQHEQQALSSGQSTPHMAAASARVTEANIRAQSEQAIEASRAQSELAYAQQEAQTSRDAANARIQELQLQERIALLNYANQQKMNLETVKAQLAKSAMDNATKRELAQAQLQLQQSEGQRNRDHALHLSALSNSAETSSDQLAEGSGPAP